MQVNKINIPYWGPDGGKVWIPSKIKILIERPI